jgi:CheY-like chemotaxis protein
MYNSRPSVRTAGKILLVEDDEPTLELLSLFLRKYYSLIACSSGESALDAFSSNDDIALVVTDLRMPGLNGFDVIHYAFEYLRPTGRVLPIVVLTGHGTPEDEERARSLGATCFQRKPIDIAKLHETIEKYLRRQEMQA